ncbi:MAG: hypothetical protein M3Q87_04130 [Actinomycetota bacterium]|nr:hypothetical protein [Actinomycetota bacterium]
MVKKTLILLAIAFGVYYLVTEPVGAADAVSQTATALGDGFDAVVRFFARLFD